MAHVTKALRWAVSAEGRRDLGAAIAGLLAVYTALNKAGVL